MIEIRCSEKEKELIMGAISNNSPVVHGNCKGINCPVHSACGNYPAITDCSEILKKEIKWDIVEDDRIITENRLSLYSKLEDDTNERAEEIAKYLDLVYRNYHVKYEITNTNVIINVYDRDDDYSDGITMTHEQFSSSTYLNIANEIYSAKKKEKEKAERFAKEKDKLVKEEAERKEFERLQAKFGK